MVEVSGRISRILLVVLNQESSGVSLAWAQVYSSLANLIDSMVSLDIWWISYEWVCMIAYWIWMIDKQSLLIYNWMWGVYLCKHLRNIMNYYLRFIPSLSTCSQVLIYKYMIKYISMNHVKPYCILPLMNPALPWIGPAIWNKVTKTRWWGRTLEAV